QEMAVRDRGRGRPSKAFVLSKAAHERLPGGYDELAVLAIEELARAGGDAAVERLADPRVADRESRLAHRVAEQEAAGEEVTLARNDELLAELLTDRGDAATVRPLSVPPAAPGAGPPSR